MQCEGWTKLTLTAVHDLIAGNNRLLEGADSLAGQLQGGQTAFVALLGEDAVREVAEHPSSCSSCNRVVKFSVLEKLTLTEK